MAGLMIKLGPPKGRAVEDEESEAADEAEEIASGEESSETTKAQRMAGSAFAKAVKSGDGEAVWLAFSELCAMHMDEEEGESEY